MEPSVVVKRWSQALESPLAMAMAMAMETSEGAKRWSQVLQWSCGIPPRAQYASGGDTLKKYMEYIYKNGFICYTYQWALESGFTTM